MINLGIIGCGKITNAHVQAMKETGLYTIVSLCDLNEENMKTLALAASLPSDVQKTDDYKKVIDNPQVDAVLIATHTYAHVEQALYALKKGKHILLEKPIATNAEDVDLLLRESAKSNAIVYPAMAYHHSHIYDNIMHFIHSDYLGGSNYIIASEHRGNFMLPWFYDSEKSGGAINDKFIHFFDLVCSAFAPSQPVSIFASGSTHVFREGSEIKGLLGESHILKKADILDNAMIVVEFEDDKRATFLLNMYEKTPIEGLQFFVAGLNGVFLRLTNADTTEGEIITNKDDKLSSSVIVDKSDSDSLGIGHPGGKKMFEAFYDALQGKEQKVTLASMRNAQILCFAADKSIKEKRVVQLSEYASADIDEMVKKATKKDVGKYHEMKESTRNSLEPVKRRRDFLSNLFFGIKKKNNYLKLNKNIVEKIISNIQSSKESFGLSDLKIFLEVQLPWEKITVTILDGKITVNGKFPTDSKMIKIHVAISEKGYEGLIQGTSLNKLYLTRQIKVSGDLAEARSARPFVIKFIEEVRKACNIG